MVHTSPNDYEALVSSLVDLLRGNYQQSEYSKAILPLTVLRRFDCAVQPVKDEMLAVYERLPESLENFGPVLDNLTAATGLWNVSKFDIPKLLDDPDNIANNLRSYVQGFSPESQAILYDLDLAAQITRLDKAGILYLVLGKFAEVDLHPDKVSNLELAYLYETAGEHFTPREVIRLMVNLLFIEDDDLLSKPGVKATLFDPVENAAEAPWSAQQTGSGFCMDTPTPSSASQPPIWRSGRDRRLLVDVGLRDEPHPTHRFLSRPRRSCHPRPTRRWGTWRCRRCGLDRRLPVRHPIHGLLRATPSRTLGRSVRPQRDLASNGPQVLRTRPLRPVHHRLPRTSRPLTSCRPCRIRAGSGLVRWIWLPGPERGFDHGVVAVLEGSEGVEDVVPAEVCDEGGSSRVS